MVWGFCVYFVYMIPLETDVLRKHRFQKPYKDIFQNRMGLCILYLGYGSKKLFKIMMNIAWLNLAFFVIMSNFFPNTLYEIYLDVFVIGDV